VAADLEQLPFADGSFDLVTGFNSFQFARDPVNALREARRVTKAGGQVAVAVWSEPGRSDAARFLQAVGALLPGGGGAADPFLLSSPGTLARLIEAVGLRPLAGSEVECPWVYPDGDSAWLALSRSARGTVVRAVGEVGEARTRAVVLEALQRYRRPDGSYRLLNKFTTVIARR
jgi:SAM-dependent methyltransferase